MEAIHRIRLLPSKETKLLAGHLWVYRNEVADWPKEVQPGDLADIHDARGKFLVRGYLNPRSMILGRVLAREPVPIDGPFFLDRIREAQRWRERILALADQDKLRVAYRVVHSEGDALPGLIVDRYGDTIVLQILTAGMDRRRELIVQAVDKILQPRLIVGRNDSPMREREGLSRDRSLFLGALPAESTVTINGLTVTVDLWEGQKTGLFLDQVENYRLLERLAPRAQVLDCFCYLGLWALHAARFGAARVIGIDQSSRVIEQAKTMAHHNGYAHTCMFQAANVFDDLRERDRRREAFDLIILDPPAFVKSRAQLAEALRGYKEINLRAMRLLRPGGFLITCSCSHHVTAQQFREILWEAAADARRPVRLVAQRGQNSDHPIILGMPETEYLKCFVLQVF